mmetsp:Transcript_5970/g.13581  ORF Transcript_5970/g.13581 Transcript_5970/m.13581 type:complete len:276 (+) Transcript_5970:135-962(+)
MLHLLVAPRHESGQCFKGTKHRSNWGWRRGVLEHGSSSNFNVALRHPATADSNRNDDYDQNGKRRANATADDGDRWHAEGRLLNIHTLSRVESLRRGGWCLICWNHNATSVEDVVASRHESLATTVIFDKVAIARIPFDERTTLDTITKSLAALERQSAVESLFTGARACSCKQPPAFQICRGRGTPSSRFFPAQMFVHIVVWVGQVSATVSDHQVTLATASVLNEPTLPSAELLTFTKGNLPSIGLFPDTLLLNSDLDPDVSKSIRTSIRGGRI